MSLGAPLQIAGFRAGNFRFIHDFGRFRGWAGNQQLAEGIICNYFDFFANYVYISMA